MLGPVLLRFLCSRVWDSGGQTSVLDGQVLCPQSLAVFRVSDDLLFVSDSLRLLVRRVEFRLWLGVFEGSA